MAIEKTVVEDRFGLQIADAYLKVNFITWDAVTQQWRIEYVVWSSPTAEAEGKEALSVNRVFVDFDVLPDLRKTAYEHLKTLPEFAGYKDV